MTLLMRDQENIEKGKEQGMKQGKIYGAIIAYKEMDLSEEIIIGKLQTKFQVSEAEAKKYIENAH